MAPPDLATLASERLIGAAQGLAQPGGLKFRQTKAEALARFDKGDHSTRGIAGQLKGLSQLADQALSRLFISQGIPANCALLASGGYGRQELFPYSDIDVLMLLPLGCDPELLPSLKLQIESFVSACWDEGLDIGFAVRTTEQCLAESQADISIQTSLLESRLITGNAALFHDFFEQFKSQLKPLAFLERKTAEMRQRHTKFENTPYSLEPNCKESPGGLRDLQIILWVAKAAGLGGSWPALAKAGLITPFEAKQIQRNEAFLWLVRCRLHMLAKRREDRLVFDLQTAVAESLGMKAVGNRRASEALMKRYYWAAKAVTQLNQILLLDIEERLNPKAQTMRRINEAFFDRAGMLEVASDDVYLKEPHRILETFLVHETEVSLSGLSARTQRALYNARHLMDGNFRKDPQNRATFMKILMAPRGVTHAMRLMNQTSVLGRYLWVFRRIVGQMQHDLFHVYTVDQHILMVLRNVRRFFIPEHQHEYPFCSQLASGWDKPWILSAAALFHDIAKGRGGDHSALGRFEVRRFCKTHDIAPEDAQLIEFLVAEHLTLSTVAQKEDLSNPNVITNLAKRVGNERNLTALYLLTVADIRGTSPKVWNAWKGKLLEDAYRLTLRTLGGRAPDADAEIQSRKRESLVLLAQMCEPFESHKRLWETLDTSYFMRHDAADIAWHTRHLARHVAPEPSGVAANEAPDTSEPNEAVAAKTIVRARVSPVGEGLQVVVYTPDVQDLFARICGFFDQGGFSILDAKVHTTKNGYALDTFQVVTSMLPEHYRELITMVESDLERTLAQAGPLPAPGKGRVSRRVKSFPMAPRIELVPDEKAQRWLLHISASDRVGLLYGIARVLTKHQLSVQLAKVSTLGERVEDTFLIQGSQLQNNKAQIEIESELREVLAGG
jgi:[protein-PII] uridylyltransferase